jgi:hypothetical protein
MQQGLLSKSRRRYTHRRERFRLIDVSGEVIRDIASFANRSLRTLCLAAIRHPHGVSGHVLLP